MLNKFHWTFCGDESELETLLMFIRRSRTKATEGRRKKVPLQHTATVPQRQGALMGGAQTSGPHHAGPSGADAMRRRSERDEVRVQSLINVPERRLSFVHKALARPKTPLMRGRRCAFTETMRPIASLVFDAASPPSTRESLVSTHLCLLHGPPSCACCCYVLLHALVRG